MACAESVSFNLDPTAFAWRNSNLWQIWCHKTGLPKDATGDVFGKIDQPSEIMKKLLEIANAEKGIWNFKGKPGTGKSFAATGLCEFLIKNGKKCTYITYLFDGYYIDKCDLLVVDSFLDSNVDDLIKDHSKIIFIDCERTYHIAGAQEVLFQGTSRRIKNTTIL